MVTTEYDPSKVLDSFSLSNRLRFVERDGKKILQQAWVVETTGKESWEDVPIVKEETND